MTTTPEHVPTFGNVNTWTKRSDAVSCSCGWSWKRGRNDVCGTARVFENHVRKAS